jgi:hypothetical protein
MAGVKKLLQIRLYRLALHLLSASCRNKRFTGHTYCVGLFFIIEDFLTLPTSKRKITVKYSKWEWRSQ